MKNALIDTETYTNYFLLCAEDITTGKRVHFELSADKQLDLPKIRGLMKSYTTIGFNSHNYDLPMITAACMGWDNKQLKTLSDKIIVEGFKWRVLTDYMGIEQMPSWDNIDLMTIPAGFGGLKKYAACLHITALQDLPYPPEAILELNEMELVRSYCYGDLDRTRAVYEALLPAIKLREVMSADYGVDLRSKGDAQIAEIVMLQEIGKITGKKYRRPNITPATVRYIDPGNISFDREDLQDVFQTCLTTAFGVTDTGYNKESITWMADDIEIGAAEYRMGIGGLHSQETSQHVESTATTVLFDADVTSYYPSIIIQQKLFPSSIGPVFLQVFKKLVDDRVQAKTTAARLKALPVLTNEQQNELDKANALNGALKIVCNSVFGKFGSRYSPLYSPALLLQVTLSGQLYLLQLIERLDIIGASVISANTDGVVISCDVALLPDVEDELWHWQMNTQLTLEYSHYKSISSANVNNYIAVTSSGGIKGKGCFAPGGMHKNPSNQVMYDAVKQYLMAGDSIEGYIRSVTDIRKFVVVMAANSVLEYKGSDIGKVVRFYKSTASDSAIRYVKNGNRVPRSDGCRPVMILPKDLPDDIDYAYYVDGAEKLLTKIGVKNA